MHSWFVALAHSALGRTMQNSKWGFALVETVHLLAIAALGGSVLLVDLRLLGVILKRESARVIGRLQTVSIPHPGPLGGMIDDSQRARPPNTTYVRTRVTCIPERGRLTIQLVADVPLEK